MSSAALVLLLPALLFTAADTDAGPPRDPLSSVAPLLGRWVAELEPKQPGVTGWTTFERGLGDRVVVRKNHASYPPKDGRPASEHDDLMVVFSEDGKLRASYWDNEGHVIRYEVQAPAANRLVFLSEARPGAPRFRLTYAWPQAGSWSSPSRSLRPGPRSSARTSRLACGGSEVAVAGAKPPGPWSGRSAPAVR